jgi:hypothetical protein
MFLAIMLALSHVRAFGVLRTSRQSSFEVVAFIAIDRGQLHIAEHTGVGFATERNGLRSVPAGRKLWEPNGTRMGSSVQVYPLWVPTIGGVVLVSALILVMMGKYAASRDPYACVGCGYDLVKLRERGKTVQCPECGLLQPMQ